MMKRFTLMRSGAAAINLSVSVCTLQLYCRVWSPVLGLLRRRHPAGVFCSYSAKYGTQCCGKKLQSAIDKRAVFVEM